MKRILLLTICALLTTNAFCLGQDTLPGGLGKELRDPAKLKAVIESGDPKYVVVDVRTKSEYEQGHIPSAISIPYGRTANIKNPPEKDKYIIVYCSTGVRSQAAARDMLADGYKYVLDWGGIWDSTFSGKKAWPYELKN